MIIKPADRFKLNKLVDNEEELRKCKESPLYFYNTYVRRDDQPVLTQEEYDRYIEMVTMQRHRMGGIGGGEVFMHPKNVDEVYTIKRPTDEDNISTK